MEESFKILSKKGKELLESLGWVEEIEENINWEFKPNLI